jgi:hypothetical protein
MCTEYAVKKFPHVQYTEYEVKNLLCLLSMRAVQKFTLLRIFKHS